MDLGLFCYKNVEAEKPNAISNDLVSYFSLQKLFKDYKKKKPNRALQVSLKEIVKIEKKLKTPEFHLSESEKQQLFS